MFCYVNKREALDLQTLADFPVQNEPKESNLDHLLKHGRYVNWRARREKEKAYFRQIRMVMAQAREGGMIED